MPEFYIKIEANQMNQKYDVALMTVDLKIAARCKEIAATYDYAVNSINPDYNFSGGQAEFRLIVIGGAIFSNGGEFSALLTVIRKSLPQAFILYIDTKASVENAPEIAKTYKAEIALNEQEFFDTSKADYIFSQAVRATFLPIKSSDLSVNGAITFDIYHLLPLREKFLKFCFVGDVIDEKKFEKLKSVDELYIHRNDAAEFAKYLNISADNSLDGLNRRCRGQFLALYAGYMRLVLNLTDQSQMSSFQKGTELFSECRNLASSLLNVLVCHPNPWAVSHNSIIGDFGSIERGPAVAAYSGIIGIKMELDSIVELMTASLVSELGLLFLSRKITSHLRNDSIDKLTADEAKEYFKYPNKSIAVILDRKIQLSDAFRVLTLGIHEKADKTGFPQKRLGKNIPIESFAIHFAFELDRRAQVRMGKPRIDLVQAIRALIQEESTNPCHFTLTFVHKIKLALKSELEA